MWVICTVCVAANAVLGLMWHDPARGWVTTGSIVGIVFYGAGYRWTLRPGSAQSIGVWLFDDMGLEALVAVVWLAALYLVAHWAAGLWGIAAVTTVLTSVLTIGHRANHPRRRAKHQG